MKHDAELDVLGGGSNKGGENPVRFRIEARTVALSRTEILTGPIIQKNKKT